MLSPLLAIFFANPFALVATAAGAVSIPIIIHLLNRKRFRIVPWAAMRFLLAAEKKNSRRLRIEQILLLIVRGAMVLLLLLAMASVTDWAEKLWARALPEGTILTSPGGARTHRVLVVDGSLSMGLKVGDTTCFERARELALRLVKESTRGDGFSVVLMAGSPRRVVGAAGPSDDTDKVTAELENLRLPHGNGDLAAALETVADLLKQSPGKFVDREVYFLTDLQRATWVLPQPGQAASALQTIQARARTIVLDVGAETPPPNLAVTRLALLPGMPVAVSGAPVVFLGNIYNHGPETPDQVRVTLRVGKAPSKAGDAPFAWRDLGQVTQRMARGQNAVSFTCQFNTPGDYAVQIRLEGDALDLDDAFTAVVPVRQTVPVLLVNGKPAADRYDQATEYLFDALNPFQEGPAPPLAPVRPKKLSAAEFADANLGDLSERDCVFLCDVPRLSGAEVRRLEAHVLRGGGVVFALGPNVDLASYNDLLYKGGQGLLPGRLLGRQRAPRGYHFHLDADKETRRLPPLAAFAQERDWTRLSSAPFAEFIRTEAPSAQAVGVPPRRVLNFLAAPEKVDQPRSTDPAVYLREPAVLDWQPLLPQATGKTNPEDRRGSAPASRGRVLLLTSTVNTDWTDWPRQANFVWLMQELLAHACSGRLRERYADVGDTLEHYLPGAAGEEKEVTVHTPDDRTETTVTVNRDDNAVYRWSDTDIAGIYRTVVGKNPSETLFAVNPPSASDGQLNVESNLSRAGEEELHKLYSEWELQVVRDPGDAIKDGKKTLLGGGGEVQRQQVGTVIARWLLLMVLVLIVVEVLLAWHFGHYSAVHEQGRAQDGWFRGRAATGLRIALNVAMGFLIVFTLLAGFTLIHAAHTGDFLGYLPASWRSGIESALGIPPPAPGEGSRWNLEFRPFLWDAAADPWLVPLLGAALVALVVWIYRRESRVAGQGGSRIARLLVLCGLRIGLLLVMLAILLPQLRLWFERQSWPDVAILIDESASMAETDLYRDPQIKEMAEKLTAAGELTKPERLALAQAVLTRGEEDWVTRLLTGRQVKVHIYRCSTRAAKVASVTRPEDIEEAVKGIRGLEAKETNDSSQLGAAVRQVLNDFRGSSLAALIMFTDGVTTEGEDISAVSKYAAQLKVPLFFVGIGDAQESRDVSLSNLEAAESVFVNDNLIFRFDLAVKGYGDNPGSVRVRLREKGSDKDLAVQTVTPEAGGKPTKVRLEHRPDKPGEKTYVIDVPVRPDEVDKENNRLEKQVYVSEAKMIKVLYVEGYGRWEYRAVKTLLERESDRLKNNKTMDLKVFLVESDPEYARQDKSALMDLPTRNDLFKYDVVILGDVDPDPKDDKKKIVPFLKDLAEFVRERGGGLLMVAGERHAPHAYKDTPLRDVLPIDIAVDRPAEEPDGGRVDSFRPELTIVGRMHPIFSFNEKEPDPVWKKLKEMYWCAEGYTPKRAAEVLAVHPTKKGLGLGGKEDKHPLVVQQFSGAGRTLFLGVSETWRWRWREDELRFNQFWIQTVRYLARSRIGRVELRLDKQTPYQRGEPIKMTVRFPDDDKPPPPDSDVRVMVFNRDRQERQTVKLASMKGTRASFEAVLTRTPEGRYEFELTQPRVSPGSQPRAEARVLPPPGEKQKVQMNQPDMEAAARETRGRFYTLAESEQVLDELPSGSRVTLNAPGPPWLVWNHWLLVIVALLFLSAEWVLRKRYHLL